MLGNSSKMECLMLSAPTRHVKRSNKTMIFYLSMFFLMFVIQLLFTFPSKYLINWLNEIVGLPAAQVYINITLTITCLIFYSLASKTCPGYVTNKEVDFITLLDSIDSTQLCPDCKTIRTSRSRHCSVCGHCIERFDHHCPWLNNCIGVKNHNYFYLYVLTQECVIVFAFVQAIVSIISFINNEDISETGTPFVPHLDWHKLPGLFYPMVILLILVTGLFLIPVGLLVFV